MIDLAALVYAQMLALNVLNLLLIRHLIKEAS